MPQTVSRPHENKAEIQSWQKTRLRSPRGGGRPPGARRTGRHRQCWGAKVWASHAEMELANTQAASFARKAGTALAAVPVAAAAAGRGTDPVGHRDHRRAS